MQVPEQQSGPTVQVARLSRQVAGTGGVSEGDIDGAPLGTRVGDVVGVAVGDWVGL